MANFIYSGIAICFLGIIANAAVIFIVRKRQDIEGSEGHGEKRYPEPIVSDRVG